ncbi:ferredoxin reductase [Dermatobacter hominis]|uniref:ferredoxin reductase n=1 Tax=Dermatobacter hominis TaxID=2884263 RepID=UPI001D0F74B5|nr:ferredoxin reductase [Dermatobacter hominis]UDY34696.1 ferredoxin reductase [Dermatobacter hominis]
MATAAAPPSVRSALQRLSAVLTWPAPAGSYRRLVDPLAAGTGVRAEVEAVVPESPRAATVVLRPGPGWQPHRPGQWVSVGVDVDGVRHHRCYSITSPPTLATLPGRAGDRITITVQAVPDGVVSNHLVRVARPGDVVHLDGPDGDFTLADPPAATGPRRMLMVTGGSGLTPVIGMVRAMDAGVERDGTLDDVVLVHHAPTPEESLFTDELHAIGRRRPGLRLHLVTTGTGAPPPELEITAARLDELCPDWREREAWACGPRPLVDAVTSVWDEHTATTPDALPLHVERFTPSVAPAGGAVEGTLTFGRSGASVASDGTRTVLDLAEEAGLDPISGCRMGVCRRCVVPLRSGTVVDMRDGRTECEPGTHVQICVAAPVGDAEIDI